MAYVIGKQWKCEDTVAMDEPCDAFDKVYGMTTNLLNSSRAASTIADWRFVGTSGIKRRLGVVFDEQLSELCRLGSEFFSDQSESHVDPGGNTGGNLLQHASDQNTMA